MQDPLHYPHGTKFMAPGPLGQCHSVPQDTAIRAEMVRAAKNYSHIYSLYNFDYDPEPGSVQYKIDQRIKRAMELELENLGEMVEVAEAELAAEAGANPVMQLAELPSPAAAGSSRGSVPPAFASLSMSGSMAPFASMTLGMSKASKVVMDALTQAGKHVPARRPRVLRPSHMRRQ